MHVHLRFRRVPVNAALDAQRLVDRIEISPAQRQYLIAPCASECRNAHNAVVHRAFKASHKRPQLLFIKRDTVVSFDSAWCRCHGLHWTDGQFPGRHGLGETGIENGMNMVGGIAGDFAFKTKIEFVNVGRVN